jgi:hypothetical protein
MLSGTINTSGVDRAKLASDTLPSDVERFCRDRDLLTDLPEAISLISANFDMAVAPSLSVETDPETGEQWLEISVAARGTVAEIAAARRQHNRQWLVAAPLRIKENVRLFLHVAPE